MKNVTPIDRLSELAKLCREGGIKKLRLTEEGIDLEMGGLVYGEAILPHVKDPLENEDVLFHSAGPGAEMPEVPSGLLEVD